jgi:hypothetical protein
MGIFAGIILEDSSGMRTMLTIVSALIMIYAALPQRVYAQARATATVTATVIPSISLELMKSNAVITKEETSPLAINFRGTGNILVVVDSKEVKSANIFQLTTEKSTKVIIPSSSQAGRTSITYLSS